MTILLPGQNAPLTQQDAEMVVSFGGRSVVDVSAYLLDSSGKVRGDEDMVFYGQTANPSRSVRLQVSDTRRAVLSLDLSRVPEAIERIAVCAAVDKTAAPNGTLSDALPIEVEIAAYRFAPVPERSDISAITLIELYRRNGAWKLRAVGQGFAGGLKPLSQLYGVDIAEDAPAAPPAPPPPPPISLSKVSLSKARPTIDLKKGSGSFGTIAVNLNWNRGAAPKRGLFGAAARADGAIDLDLACLYELADGSKGAVQALGKRFGSLDQPPFIKLAGDDRSGDAAEGEWLHVAGAQWSRIRRVLVYAFIYDGVPNWAATDGVVTIGVANQPPVEVRLDEGSGLGLCAIGLLENVGGDIRVSREVRYFEGASEMDRAYGWGMRWTAGSK